MAFELPALPYARDASFLISLKRLWTITMASITTPTL